jgi:hypothetical protein
MVKPASVLIYGLLAYFGFKAINKASAAKKLQFFVSKVSIRFSGITPILDVVLGINNPTGETLRIGGIAGDLSINGAYVGAIFGYQITDVKSLATSYYPISARLSLSGVVTQAAEIIEAIINGDGINALFNQTIGFKGNVNAEGFTIPLNFSYKVL